MDQKKLRIWTFGHAVFFNQKHGVDFRKNFKISHHIENK